MQERFDKLIIAEKLHSFSIFGNLEKMIECVDSIKNPDFENHNLNSDMLDKFWNDKKPKILRKVITKGLKSVIELQLEQISRKPKMFGRKICSIWDEVARMYTFSIPIKFQTPLYRKSVVSQKWFLFFAILD